VCVQGITERVLQTLIGCSKVKWGQFQKVSTGAEKVRLGGRQAADGGLGNSPLVPTLLVSFRFVSIIVYRFMLCISCNGPIPVAARSKT